MPGFKIKVTLDVVLVRRLTVCKSFGNPIANFNRSFISAQVGGDKVFLQCGANRVAKRMTLGLPTKKIEHHARSENRAERIGNPLPGDVGRGAVYGFK